MKLNRKDYNLVGLNLLDKLPSNYNINRIKRIMTYWVNGLTFREIGEIEKISSSRVSQLVQKGVKALEKIYQRYQTRIFFKG